MPAGQPVARQVLSWVWGTSEREAATSEILRVISRSPSDVGRCGRQRANLPVEQPTKFALVIERRGTALGLTIRPALLARADQVIE